MALAALAALPHLPHPQHHSRHRPLRLPLHRQPHLRLRLPLPLLPRKVAPVAHIHQPLCGLPPPHPLQRPPPQVR